MTKTRGKYHIYAITCNLHIWLFLTSLIFFPSAAICDIYRFVDIDGVEIFTDTPNRNGGEIVIRDAKKKTGMNKIPTQQKRDAISLDEIAEKTVQASLHPPQHRDGIFNWRIPFPESGITSGVGMRIDPFDGKWRQHNGIDMAVNEGTPVRPNGDGTVIYSGFRTGYGNTVIVEHYNGIVTLYGHNSKLLVKTGEAVNADTVIALSGNTGRSTAPHLHFEAWQSGENITMFFLSRKHSRRALSSVASRRASTRLRMEQLPDGSILFTNIPSSIP